jgi:hypothetical protein
MSEPRISALLALKWRSVSRKSADEGGEEHAQEELRRTLVPSELRRGLELRRRGDLRERRSGERKRLLDVPTPLALLKPALEASVRVESAVVSLD